MNLFATSESGLSLIPFAQCLPCPKCILISLIPLLASSVTWVFYLVSNSKHAGKLGCNTLLLCLATLLYPNFLVNLLNAYPGPAICRPAHLPSGPDSATVWAGCNVRCGGWNTTRSDLAGPASIAAGQATLESCLISCHVHIHVTLLSMRHSRLFIFHVTGLYRFQTTWLHPQAANPIPLAACFIAPHKCIWSSNLHNHQTSKLRCLFIELGPHAVFHNCSGLVILKNLNNE